jgi:GTP-sensing pleiotropic transcriptional regulator CodY
MTDYVIESFRADVINMMEGVSIAEREACAKIAAEIGGVTGKLIADRIRKRPPFPLPPMAFDLKDMVKK